jgi:hypothetical protein
MLLFCSLFQNSSLSLCLLRNSRINWCRWTVSFQFLRMVACPLMKNVINKSPITFPSLCHYRNLDYATGWTIGESCFDSQKKKEIFLFSTEFRPALGPTSHCIQRVMRRMGAVFSEEKPPRSQDIYTRPPSADGQEVELHFHSPPIILKACTDKNVHLHIFCHTDIS